MITLRPVGETDFSTPIYVFHHDGSSYRLYLYGKSFAVTWDGGVRWEWRTLWVRRDSLATHAKLVDRFGPEVAIQLLSLLLQ